jgi:hypothetical protein
MRCRKSQEYISRSIDGELSARDEARLEKHLAGCGDCRALDRDLRRIVEGAARLETPEPSAKVWEAVRAGLERETAKEAGERRGSTRRPAFEFALGFGRPALRAAAAVALVLALVAAGLLIGRRSGRGGSPAGLEARERYTLAKLDEAERYYEKAIQSLTEAFASGRGTLPREVAEVFDRNLSVVDATIQACRQSVLDAPDDLEARNYLMTAYMQKMTLLDSALDLQRGGRTGTGKTKRL